MKKYIIIVSLLGLVSLPEVKAQIKTNAVVRADIVNQNPFIDASSQSAYPSVGKGIVFPRTNLTTFKFKTDLFDGLGLIFPTAFDGMLVYNTHVEENATIDDPATGSYTLDLKEGFYYFSNPTGNTSGNLAGGRWKPLGSGANISSFYSQNGKLSGDREVNLDNHNLNFTGGNVGINTATPKATLDIVKGSNGLNGILIPRLTTSERESMNNKSPDTGLLIYNTDRECYESNIGTPTKPQWDCVAMQGQTQKIFIKPHSVEGTWVSERNNNPETNKIKFKIINKSAQALNNIDFSYVQLITGCCADVLEGQNNDVTIPAQDSVILTYKVGGDVWADQLQFLLAYDQNIEGVLTINGTDTGSYDSNTGTYQGNGGTATIGEYTHKLFSVNETVENTEVNKEITITNESPLIIEIPYTNGSGNYESETVESPSFMDKAGNPRQLELTVPGGYFGNTLGTLKVTIKPKDGQPLTLPQTQLEGNLSIVDIPININGQNKGTLKLLAYGGIKDRHFGDGEHDFVYTEVTAEDGTTWLNNNLGAEYSNIHSDVFDPTKQIQGINDLNGIGSTFEVGRAADGHEIMIIEDGQRKNKYEYTTELATSYQPATKLRIVNPKRNLPNINERKYDWVEESLYPVPVNMLWAKDGENNPCPTGYEVPTKSQLNSIVRYTTVKNKTGLFQGKLKLIDDTWSRETGYWRIMANNSMIRVFPTGNNFKYIRCRKAQ
ncbi:hypothetical protein KRX57_02380 [Weeksellaceae bacterium TAE3-ERU29]|nr:hypothetical protein [Weeksellaceae bacterium TAE3-ERU29]